MTRKPITLKSDARIYDALEIFDQHKISCLPIVDTDNRPVEIISWRDILRNIKSNLAKYFDAPNQLK